MVLKASVMEEIEEWVKKIHKHPFFYPTLTLTK